MTRRRADNVALTIAMNRLDEAAVALRTAAYEFARLGPPTDSEDRDGQRVNRKLLRAALRYAQEKVKYGD